MKASDLIARLCKVVDEEGDQEVRIWDLNGYDQQLMPIHRVVWIQERGIIAVLGEWR